MLSFLFIIGCKSKLSPTEQIKLQTPLIPVMIDLESSIYAEALVQKPSILTKKIYDASISKGMLLQRMLSEAKDNDEFENTLEAREINSLCLMGKFLLSQEHKNSMKMSGEAYDSFFIWLNEKQTKWQNLLGKENPKIFNTPCLLPKH